MSTSAIGALRANLGLDSARFEKGLRQSERSVSAFKGRVLKMASGLGAAFAGAMTIRGAGKMADEWSDLSSRVGNAVGSMDAAPEVMGRIQDMARASYSDLSQTVEAFVANNQALKDLGLTTEQQLDYTEALNNALVISGAKGMQAAQVQDALSKAMATGKLSGDGLNAVLSRGERVAQALADELGTTVSGLRAVGTQGGITADVIQRALTGRLQELRDEAAEMPATMADGFTLIRNSMLALVGTMDQTTGASAGVAGALVGIADAISAVTKWISTHGEMITTVFQTMLGSVAVLATAFAGRYAIAVGVTAVKAMVSAWRSSVALNMALGAQTMGAARAGAAIKLLTVAFHGLRAALISTGIGALVVAAGFLVGKFTQLVAAAGGFGAAMSVLGDVAREAWTRMSLRMDEVSARITAAWKGIQAAAYEVFASIISGAVEFANRYVGIYRGAFGAVVAIWGALPSAIGDLAYQAAGKLVEAVGWMLRQVAKPIDGFLGILNQGLEKMGKDPIDLIGDRIKLPKLNNPYAGAMRDLGGEAADAFMEGFSQDVFSQPTGVLEGLQGSAADLRDQVDAYREAAGMLSRAASGPMTAWQRLKMMVSSATDEVSGIPPVADDAGEALSELGEKGGGGSSGGGAGDKIAKGLKKAKDEMDEFTERANRGADAVGDVFSGLLDRTRSLRDGIADLIMEIAKMQMMKGFRGLFGANGAYSGIGDWLGGLLGANANGTNNWRGGLTRINERGGEIVDLPSGTRIIPHDVSKRMVDGGSDGGVVDVRVYMDDTGNWQAQVERISGRVSARAVAGSNRSMSDRQYLGSR